MVASTRASRPGSSAAAAALLVDVLLLLGFAALGRRSHGEDGAVRDVVVVALPFVLGWLAAAVPAGLGWRPLAPGRALAAWAVGIPVGLVLRGTLFGRGDAASFVVVALLTTLVLLVGRRLAARAVPVGRRPGHGTGDATE